ncbi:cysteine synthase family protein [uncultured Algimonas sp.]|uniref:PLP-dependent cysteine synthase family protein n=1 Tax=uncultured Algimonas sp. TaxID=1547920 RepID=UPI00262B4392|nr:cysteine synthase family protein [uncultured Algimonas sp.]
MWKERHDGAAMISTVAVRYVSPMNDLTLSRDGATALEPKAFTCLERLIGDTPMIAIDLSYRTERRRVLAKLEYFNLSGSIKDRMALAVLRRAYATGALRPGDTIAEATSGNAGIALAALGRALGHPVVIYMPDWMSVERVALMKSYGADVRLVSHDEGGFLGSIAKTRALADARDNVFLPRQFENAENCNAHCRTTGPEILAQAQAAGSTLSAFVAGVGTGGTVMGVGRALRAADPSIRIHPVEPAESPTLSTGYKVGKHRIQGVSDDFIPDIMCLSSCDAVIAVNDGDGILMAQRLSAELGLGVGISSGANLVAAVKAGSGGGHVATVFCDDSKKYLSTDLTRVEPVRDGYLSPDIVLHGFEVIG